MPDISDVPLLVAFAGLNRYTAQIDRLDDLEVARVMSSYYELAADGVERAGGRVVKFIGDAALAVFPERGADRGVQGLLELKQSVDRFMEGCGWECRMVVRVHFGSVAAGEFGSGSSRRYDVLGKTVNVAARLESSGVALSAEAFRTLGADLRREFKKHTPPVTYIRQEDAHRPRWAKR